MGGVIGMTYSKLPKASTCRGINFEQIAYACLVFSVVGPATASGDDREE